MGHLHVTLLGVPAIQHDGQGVVWRTRKTQALLIYLAVEGGLHTRQQVTNLFWPERDQRHGRTMLRTTLVYLRQALQPNSDPAQPHLPHLLVNENTLGFDFASDFTLDLHTLQAALDLARTAANSPQALAQLAAAVQWRVYISLKPSCVCSKRWRPAPRCFCLWMTFSGPMPPH